VAKDYRVSYWNDDKVLKFYCKDGCYNFMNYEHTKNHTIIHFEWVNCMAFYLNRALIKKFCKLNYTLISLTEFVSLIIFPLRQNFDTHQSKNKKNTGFCLVLQAQLHAGNPAFTPSGEWRVLGTVSLKVRARTLLKGEIVTNH
jgi:hypothetical protein